MVSLLTMDWQFKRLFKCSDHRESLISACQQLVIICLEDRLCVTRSGAVDRSEAIVKSIHVVPVCCILLPFFPAIDFSFLSVWHDLCLISLVVSKLFLQVNSCQVWMICEPYACHPTAQFFLGHSRQTSLCVRAWQSREHQKPCREQNFFIAPSGIVNADDFIWDGSQFFDRLRFLPIRSCWLGPSSRL